MTKVEFLNELKKQLNGLPENDLNERLSFYDEMIEDRKDEGKSEEEAVNEIGPVDKVANEILAETPLYNLIKERVKPKRALRGWEIVLLVLGFPLWFPLVTVFFILCLVAYLLVWVGVLVMYALELGFASGAIGGIVLFFINLGTGVTSYTYLGIGILSIGLTILLIFGCIGVTKGTYKLSKKIALRIKSMFIKKGETK